MTYGGATLLFRSSATKMLTRRLRVMGPTSHGSYPARIDFVGDDWAIQTLVESLIQHPNDPRMIAQSGPAEGNSENGNTVAHR